jgi:hypothetical protein
VLLALLALLIAAPASAEIRVYDVPAGSVRTFDGELTGWTPDGTGLLVSRDGSLGHVDLASGLVTPASEPKPFVGPLGHWLAPEADKAVLRAPDDRVLAEFRTLLGWSEPGVAWSRDGSRVAVVTHYGLWVVDTATGQTLVRNTRDTYLTEQAFAPDGSALVISQRRRVLRVDVPSGRVTPVYTAREPLPLAAWSVAGRLAITTEDRILVPGAPALRVESPDPALWSADGGLLRFKVSESPDGCSYPWIGLAVAAPGAAPRTLVEPSERELGAARWSPVAPLLAADVGPEIEEPKRGKRKPWPKRIARDYEMFSRRGNAAVRQIVLRASRSLRRGAGREAVLARVRQDFAEVYERHPEIGDTAVRERLGDELDRWLVAAGFEVIDAYDEITC